MTGRARRPQLLVATRSEHKLRELRELLHPAHAELVSLDDVGIPDEVEETGRTFEANARLKARAYARLSGRPTLADDSGLEVDALDGGPGVRTKRYAGDDATDRENNLKLLDALRGLPPDRRAARYVCVLALVLPDESSRSRRRAHDARHAAGADRRRPQGHRRLRLRPDLRTGRAAAGR